MPDVDLFQCYEKKKKKKNLIQIELLFFASGWNKSKKRKKIEIYCKGKRCY